MLNFVIVIFGIYFVIEIHIWSPIDQNVAHREAIRLVLSIKRRQKNTNKNDLHLLGLVLVML